MAEIKFTEWTTDGRLRHPTYLGIREDVKPEAVRREPTPLLDHVSAVRERGQMRSHVEPLTRDKREQPAADKAIDGLLQQLTQIEEKGAAASFCCRADNACRSAISKRFFGRPCG
ncbi:MAG: hypothetical protein AUI63_07045 [Gemmatimonadetes bacterium 13_1_40CM_2_60_3]|nr:MAG: hypothetical protein AUI63_07045 [Gemmatimonadetes bacterium 13_1_40CM_2_60_3]